MSQNELIWLEVTVIAWHFPVSHLPFFTRTQTGAVEHILCHSPSIIITTLEDSQILQRIFKDFSIYEQMYAIVHEQVTPRTCNPASCSISPGCHSSALTMCCTALPCHAEMLWSRKGFSKEQIPPGSYHSVSKQDSKSIFIKVDFWYQKTVLKQSLN